MVYRILKVRTKIISFILSNRFLLGILIIAATLRFVGLLPNFPYPDEAHIQVYTWDLVKNIFASGDFNPHTLKYGSWIFYLQAIFIIPILLGTYLFDSLNVLLSSSFTSSPVKYSLFQDEAVRKYSDLLLFAARFEVALFGIASVFVIYLIGKKLFNERIGLFSALFLSLAPFHVRDSHYGTTDIIFIFTVLLSLLFIIFLIQSKKLKWFILSGLALGFSVSIRFFPIVMIIYPVALLFSFEKSRKWLGKVFLSFISIFIGLFIGVPFLFLDPQGPTLLLKDLERYALPWYGTSITSYLLALITFINSGGQSQLPSVTSLAPTFFRPFYSSFIFFNGFGILPSLLALVGILLIAKRSIKSAILLLLIPALTFFYISFYIPASYEKSILPVVPFLTIFAAATFDSLFGYLKNSKILWINRLVIIFLAAILFQPLFISASASISCGKHWIQKTSGVWVDQNIQESAKIAYLTMVSVPSTKNFAGYVDLAPFKNISLEEARNLGADHVFLNAAWLDRFTYPYFIDFFVTPDELFENSYFSLVMKEYQSRGLFLHEISKPIMCDIDRLYYYRLPKVIVGQSFLEQVFNFDNADDVKKWSVQNYKENGKSLGIISFSSEEGNEREGSLKYQQDFVKYTPPRIKSKAIMVNEGEDYTFSAWVKSDDLRKELSGVILRVDFYDDRSVSLSQNIQTALELYKLRFLYGTMPPYFEKKRGVISIYNDTNLPGKVVALSSRVKPTTEWQKVSVSAQVPEDAGYVVLSIQNSTSDAAWFYVDDVETRRVESYDK